MYPIVARFFFTSEIRIQRIVTRSLFLNDLGGSGLIGHMSKEAEGSTKLVVVGFSGSLAVF